MKALCGLVVLSLLCSCDFDGVESALEDLEAKSTRINRYDRVALRLARENRQLKGRIGELKFKIKKLESEKTFLDMKNSGRKIASVKKGDLVNYETYKWTPVQMISTARREFENGNYVRSAQFFKSFSMRFPKHEKIDDRFLFQAGIVAYESGQYDGWALDYFSKVVSKHPNSPYVRGSKLWTGMIYLRQGRKKMFMNTVEEFRKKYRNTEEWKILSHHYEKINKKYR